MRSAAYFGVIAPSLEVSRLCVGDPPEAQNIIIYMVWRPTALGKLRPRKTLLWHPRPPCNRHANLRMIILIILIILAIMLLALKGYNHIPRGTPSSRSVPAKVRSPHGSAAWLACIHSGLHSSSAGALRKSKQRGLRSGDLLYRLLKQQG